jgi:ankyrin repeat protein
VELLIRHGATIDSADVHGNTALVSGVQNGHTATVIALLECACFLQFDRSLRWHNDLLLVQSLVRLRRDQILRLA